MQGKFRILKAIIMQNKQSRFKKILHQKRRCLEVCIIFNIRKNINEFISFGIVPLFLILAQNITLDIISIKYQK